MERLRTPFLVVAIVLAAVVVGAELGSLAWLGEQLQPNLPAPGMSVPSLAFMDAIVLFTLGLYGLALVVPAQTLGAIQGIITFIFSLLLLIGEIVAVFIAIALLVLMVTLLLAVPFGTIAYLAMYADFEKGQAAATLGSLLTLKIVIVVMLALAQQRMLTVKGLIFLLASSMVANLIVSFLHALVPGFLVSILDAVAAIVVIIIALIWTIVKLIGSIPGILKGLRFDRHV